VVNVAIERVKNGPFDGKVKRFFTSLVLPVDPNRTGECLRCGECCKFLVRCPFLRFSDDESRTPRCAAYFLRPPQCRKYPRTESEQIHKPCGYRFK
jgi:hypothetical protein